MTKNENDEKTINSTHTAQYSQLHVHVKNNNRVISGVQEEKTDPDPNVAPGLAFLQGCKKGIVQISFETNQNI